VDTGETVELVGRTPDVVTTGVIGDAGMFTTIRGAGFSESSSVASYPLTGAFAGISLHDRRPDVRLPGVQRPALIVLDCCPSIFFRCLKDLRYADGTLGT
jgi:hypothetical protein